ncbi:carotenoid oxygenase family protein [Haloprofundus sp. MHR1]|uniref:carotenoid oxygenase family protein n=1 Tax=Haloprofundus sp. MHR1 TaxID=2572921 RepID=UPI0010BE77F1|nr:carotenoid oxygenase family protein [Haloprofundus sp. MHR1]QCJ45917.1 carotenoid oxygenase family protein [Haloprofundus sp. MHR1]
MSGDHRLGLRPATTEYADEPLRIEGEIPPWLEGTLVRNGPGSFAVGDRRVNHWFDGLAMLRRFAIGDGEVRYSNRFLRSRQFRHVREHGRLRLREFGTDPQWRGLGHLRRFGIRAATDNAPVDVVYLGGRHLAVTETPRWTVYDPETLRTRGEREFDDEVGRAGPLAHVHYDPFREEIVGVATRFGLRSEYVVYRVPDGKERREVVARIPIRRPGYLHSFALTPNYVAVLVPPFRTSPLALLRDRPFVESYRWEPERGTRVLVVDRESGELVVDTRTAPCFVFHHVNAFERGGALHLDVAAFEDASVVDAFSLDSFDSPEFAPPGAELRRLQVDPETGHVVTRALHPGHVEFPTIHYGRHNTHPYRYVYGVGTAERSPEGYADRIVKIDLGERDGQFRASRTWTEPNVYPGEPLFVPRVSPETDGDGEETVAEDDGALLSVVLDADAERSFLLILDAATMTERARAVFDAPIPFDFHGQFYRSGERPTRSMA